MSSPSDRFAEGTSKLADVRRAQYGSDYLHEYTGVLTETDERVRILTLAPEFAENDDAIDAFTRVTDQWETANANPNIVTIRNRDTTPRPWIAVSVTNKKRLETVYADLAPEAIATVIAETAEALRTFGLYNAVHGHLSPADIWISDTNDQITVQVGGFGLEQAVGAAVGEVEPTPYTAPELLDSPGQPSQQTDVYGLAAVTYFVLAGKPPIEGSNLKQAIREGPIGPPSTHRDGISPTLDGVVMQALSTQPSDRQDSPHTFKSAFLAAFDPTAFDSAGVRPDEEDGTEAEEASPDEQPTANGTETEEASPDEQPTANGTETEDTSSSEDTTDTTAADTDQVESKQTTGTDDETDDDTGRSIARRGVLVTIGAGLAGVGGISLLNLRTGLFQTNSASSPPGTQTPTAQLTPDDASSGQPIGSSPTQERIAAENGDSYDRFGGAVALSDDGTTAIVGAAGDDDPNGTSGDFGGAGAAYVFSTTDGEWEQQTVLAADDGAEGDAFGTSVAISGDGTTALIGALRDNASGSSAGSAYIFTDSGDEWRQSAKITARDGDGNDSFGSAVALADSATTALIGAPNDEDPNGTEPGTYNGAGSAYVFTQSAGTWSQQTKLAARDGDADDGFGWAVSLSADGTTALLGANNDEDPNGTGDNLMQGAGSAYVFTQTDGRWSQQTKIAPDNGDGDDQFGTAVSLGSNGTTALIGAPQDEDAVDWAAGTAYVFTQNGGEWTQTAQLNADDGDRYDYFGTAVSLAAAGTMALIGANEDEDPNGDQAGSAYLFTGESEWRQETKLVAADGDSDDRFGSAVTLSEDATTALIGAHTDEDPNGSADSSYSGAGSAYIFD
ncbi:protein kinase domain-containing protein [Haloarcula laminariae]|uniref:protein kinase domain-containing protein n=1 Tax=Haloarcula laminariae TaxID=2961577 RepID=UPI00240715A4|nr:hypothetical protein [Halomicroarcula sp. FL173]